MKPTISERNQNCRELFADDGGFCLVAEATQDGAIVARKREQAEQAKAEAEAAQLRLAMPEHPPLPRGWTLETFESFGKPFARAIDADGCKWYGSTGRWVLNVPWFRRSPGLPYHKADDLAVVETVEGNRAYPITEKGTILIGSRRIGPQQWDH